MNRSFQVPLLLFSFLLFTGMAGGGQTSGAQLKPELRLKIYNEAIRHFEKAKTLRAQGRMKDALHELHKATKVVRAFPEVYDLARQIYLEMENEEEAGKQAELFKNYGGNEGVSLYRLREDVARVVRARKKMARPPDFRDGPSHLFSGTLVGVLLMGMFYDFHRRNEIMKGRSEGRSILLGSFPSDDEEAIPPSWLFKLCTFLLPAPLIFSLLLVFGVRYYSDLIPVLLFAWIVVDAALYFIFFADLSDLGGGMRRPV